MNHERYRKTHKVNLSSEKPASFSMPCLIKDTESKSSWIFHTHQTNFRYVIDCISYREYIQNICIIYVYIMIYIYVSVHVYVQSAFTITHKILGHKNSNTLVSILEKGLNRSYWERLPVHNRICNTPKFLFPIKYMKQSARAYSSLIGQDWTTWPCWR